MSGQNLPRNKLRESLSRILEVADVRRIAAETLRNQEPVTVAGLGGGSVKGLFLAALWQSLRRPIVLVTPDDEHTAVRADPDDALRSGAATGHQERGEHRTGEDAASRRPKGNAHRGFHP